MKTPDTNAKKILLVEDETAICELCQRVLSSEGFQVDTAANGKVAQDMIVEKQYDLCLIDVRLPAMTGKELHQWLKEKHPKLASRVIFTTGDVMGGDTQIFLEQASRPFLPKPFTQNDLKAVARETLKQLER